ncbi:intein-containing Rv2578c family radical SAM protein [Longispora albida]|uniref:intein-containing Rv2578c family radical SAM protein n=1 Tax=Longispora albida TaxID=203523 RepID=UPI000364F6B6|nr:intein-containing Rv2578c family radical SAM protein [Longispora albida]
MRWSHLQAEATQSADGELPLHLPDSAVRTFETPGFAGMTFYEIRAKSIVNKVSGESDVPFQWTVNPYRGCSHACVYCLDGDTPILMADGRHRRLADLQAGDEIYGTERQGNYRRYVTTTVLDHWISVKPAFRVTLADGTSIVASGDHRFLTERGWKHVTNADPGHGKRPHLTTSNKLMGTGQFAPPPEQTDEYRLGYMAGMARESQGSGSGFRLVIPEAEAVDRMQEFLAHFGVPSERVAPTASRPKAGGLRSRSRSAQAMISNLIAWPVTPSDDWCLGLLAGIFDAAGSYGRGILRIPTADKDLVDAIELSLERFEFDFVIEDRGFACFRLLGGLREHLRFFHGTDPAITAKWTIEGTALKSNAPLGIVSIEPVGQRQLYDITTGTGDFIANGVVSHNCFARGTHQYLDLDAGLDFDQRIVVKTNAPELLRRELAAPKWRGAHIAMGTNVDCYQRAEGKYLLMPGIIEALRDFRNPFSILTKGTLILRDLELLREAAEVTSVSIAVSVGFTDPAMWRAVEPGAPSPNRRLDVVRALTDAGLAVSVLMAPVLPGLTDSAEEIEHTVAAIASAGAVSITPLALHLRPGAREWFMAWLAREHPGLVEVYKRLYGPGSYLPKGYQRELTARVRSAARRHGIDPGGTGRARRLPASISEGRAAQEAASLTEMPAVLSPAGAGSTQLTLL